MLAAALVAVMVPLYPLGSSAATGSVDTQVLSSTDDAEERASGSVSLTSSDLEMILDNSGDQVIGLRFTNITVPAGAAITGASIQFTADEVDTDPASLIIAGQAADDPPAFSSTSNDVTSRATTAATVPWNPGPWDTVGMAGPDQQTADLSPVVQQIVSRPNWTSGNSIVFIITGTGKRVADSFDGDPDTAPLLHLDYSTDGSVPNQPPSVDAGQDLYVALPAEAQLDGTVTDDQQPDPPASVQTTWTQVGGPGVVNFADAGAVDTSASFTLPGTYTVQLEATDTELTTQDTATIYVTDPAAPADRLPFGVYSPDIADMGSRWSGAQDTLFAPDAIADLDALRAAGSAVIVGLSGFNKEDVQANGIFDMVKWKAKVDEWVGFGLEPYISDGTILGHYLIDEPKSTTNWGGQVVVNADLDEMAAYSNSLFPGLATMVRVSPTDLRDDALGEGVPDPSWVWQHLTTAWGQFRANRGPVESYADEQQAEAVAQGLGMVFSLSAITGGDGSSGVEGLGGYTGKFAMSAAEITVYGNVLMDTGCAFLMWTGNPAQSSGPEAPNGWLYEPAIVAATDALGVTAATTKPPSCESPVVYAGPDQTVFAPGPAVLDATVNAGDLGEPPAMVTTTWTQSSGPGTATFADASSVDTSVTFDTAGVYRLKLQVTKGSITNHDGIVITAQGDGATSVDVAVSASSDDAEERSAGRMGLDSSDLEMTQDSSHVQTIGIRFADVPVPPGATVGNAYIQFTVDETGSDPTSLTIAAQADDNPATFITSTGDITLRPVTPASISWSPAPWTTIGAAGADQQTANLAPLVQQLINRPGWATGNAMAFIVSGSGRRVAESADGSSGDEPVLHIDFTVGDPPPPPNEAPSVDAGLAQTITLPTNTASLNGSVGDDGLPDPPATTTATWTQLSGPPGVTFTNPDSPTTTATFPEAGVYTLQLQASDTDLTTTDTTTITVNDPSPPTTTTLDVRIDASNNDVEQRASGSLSMRSSDLEMTLDNSGTQLVGMRFSVPIPAGATITKAYVQFRADESHGDPASLVIYGEASDNAAPFLKISGNVSSRPPTSAQQAWSPPAWSTGDAGPAQRTPDLAALVQEIVDRQGWGSGNSLVIIVSGTGKRVAESYDGTPSAAPLLHIEFAS